ncbi:hypothetical protein B0H12DRAFT_46063 [Mycena haematopus]|nr:hypothetical protein B0H12DRAFT_46063 [Mycena haematopus]
MTVSAAVRFTPSPPRRVLRRKSRGAPGGNARVLELVHLVAPLERRRRAVDAVDPLAHHVDGPVLRVRGVSDRQEREGRGGRGRCAGVGRREERDVRAGASLPPPALRPSRPSISPCVCAHASAPRPLPLLRPYSRPRPRLAVRWMPRRPPNPYTHPDSSRPPKSPRTRRAAARLAARRGRSSSGGRGGLGCCLVRCVREGVQGGKEAQGATWMEKEGGGSGWRSVDGVSTDAGVE